MTDVTTQSLLRAFDKAGCLPGRPVLCALSGGLDSMVLLHLLKAAGLRARAVHIDHAIHADSQNWAEWVAAQCEAAQVPLVVHRLTDLPGEGSPEETWRNARRALFLQELRQDEVLVTAHHEDDQFETLLLQLFRGAGPTGLQGMPLFQRLPTANLHVRPLLGHSRAELDAYARTHPIEFLNDPSNADTRFDRNFLRNDIVPALKSRWPSIGAAVARSSELIAESVALTETLAAQDVTINERDGSLDWESLSVLDAARQANAVRHWLKQLNARMPNRRRLSEALRQWSEASRDRLPVLVLDGGTVQRYRSRLVYQPVQTPGLGDWTGVLTLGQWLALPGEEGHLGLIERPPDEEAPAQRGEAVLAVDQVAGQELSVRYRRHGEKLRRAGGHHQKLKHWFQQNDVPPLRRSRLPLVFLGAELVAIADIWVDARFRFEPSKPGEQKSCRLIWRAPEADLVK